MLIFVFLCYSIYLFHYGVKIRFPNRAIIHTPGTTYTIAFVRFIVLPVTVDCFFWKKLSQMPIQEIHQGSILRNKTALELLMLH